MGMYDPLFMALAQAKSMPSHALRATESALAIPGEGIEGYEQGLTAKNNISQLRMMNTKLGDIWSDPSQIPYGLGPQHTVRDLMTIAPTMQNYIPAGFANSIAAGYGAGGGPASSETPPQGPPTPPPPQTPPTPSPTPGGAQLAAIGGAGSDAGGAFAPGTPTSVPASPPSPTGPQFNFPPGGISKTAFSLAEPAMKAAQEERLKQQELAQSHSQFEQGQRQQESIFERGHATEATGKAVPALNSAAQLEAAFNGIKTINADPANKSIPFSGNVGAWYANKVPSTHNKWALNQKAAENIGDVGAGAIEKLVEGRYNDQQMARIKSSLFPTGNELGTPVADQKLAQLSQYVQQAKAGAKNQLFASLDAIAGSPVNAEAMATPVGSVLPQNPDIQAAMQWIKDNPNNPKSKAIAAKLKAMQNGI